MRKEHRQPITEPIFQMLQRMKEQRGNQRYILENGGKPLSENAMLYAVKRFDKITVHGFRSTFREWAAHQGCYDHDAIEFSLAHKLPDPTKAAYLRSDLLDKRRSLMDDWGGYVQSSV